MQQGIREHPTLLLSPISSQLSEGHLSALFSIQRERPWFNMAISILTSDDMLDKGSPLTAEASSIANIVNCASVEARN